MSQEHHLDDIWAKSPRAGQQSGETLDEHVTSVLHRMGELHQRFPQLAEQIGDDRLWYRAFWACVLHDIGKAAAPFQASLRGGSPWRQRHEIASLAFLPWIVPLDSLDFQWIAAAVASHHRDAPTIERMYDWTYPHGMAFESLLNIPDQTLDAVLQWLAEAPPRLIAEAGFSQTTIGLAQAVPTGINGQLFRQQDGRDAIVEALRQYGLLRRHMNDERADLRQAGIIQRGLMLLADRLASAHAEPLRQFRLPPPAALLKGNTPRDHQRRAAEVMKSLVLVAPTGSGKTEAALLWARQQQDDEPERGTLFYVLPYQASLNAMQSRLRQDLETDVGLLHGRSTQVLYREFLSEGYDSSQAEQAAKRAADLARLQRPAVQVATPYQLLRAAYRLPGYEMQWTTLHKATIVVDEIHAYDPPRTGLLLGLLQHLVERWDARVCAITATMPSWLRQLVAQTLTATEVTASPADFQRFRRHRLHLFDGTLDDPATQDAIAQEVGAGRAVLVAANTVGQAQRTWTALRDRLGVARTRLLHSRFTGRDRLRHEDELMPLCGLGISQRQPIAVVATQTIEVSLNLDFDTMFTEPAPLEALAQRFGRVNRTQRLPLAPVRVLTGPDDGQGIYSPEIIRRTLGVLQNYDGHVLEEDLLTTLLDAVYGEDLSQEHVRAVRRHLREFRRVNLDEMRPFESDPALEEQFDRLFDGVEVLPVSLEEEYGSIVEESRIAAQALLVPLRYQQLAGLRRANRVRSDADGLLIVDVPYNPIEGLQLVYTSIESP